MVLCELELEELFIVVFFLLEIVHAVGLLGWIDKIFELDVGFVNLCSGLLEGDVLKVCLYYGGVGFGGFHFLFEDVGDHGGC